MDVGYTLFVEDYEHALVRAKQEFPSLEASLAKEKVNMSANRESFKSSFAEVSRISKQFNDASMSKYVKRTDSI